MSLADLILPRFCPVCGGVLDERERIMCLGCLLDLPLTMFWSWSGNPAERLLAERIKVEAAASLFYYRDGSRYKSLIHSFKYNGIRKCGRYLGQMLANRLLEAGRFEDVDYVVAVPLHPIKLWKRGYNQSIIVAAEISAGLGVPLLKEVLKKRGYTSSQTSKSPGERSKSVRDHFYIKDRERVEGRHLLLVDDVLTTGATVEACGKAILEAGASKLSVVTLAFVE